MQRFYPEGYSLGDGKREKDYYSLSALEEAKATKSILRATAQMCDSEHNTWVNLGSMRGIIPREEGAIGIASGKTRDIAILSRVGKVVSFIVTDIKTDAGGTPHAILSRRIAQEICFCEYIKKLRPGDIIPARITHLEQFGAFCDIGCGIAALLPISAISVSRISHPRDRFLSGEDIKAVVSAVAPDGKITLSHKELLGSWEENAELFLQGQTVYGTIRSVESYGVFVELTPNLAGLAEPKSDVYIGQTASVYIKSLIPDKMKVKLIIIDSFDEPYTQPKKYFLSEGRIDRWQYSPPESYKTIITEFLAK